MRDEKELNQSEAMLKRKNGRDAKMRRQDEVAIPHIMQMRSDRNVLLAFTIHRFVFRLFQVLPILQLLVMLCLISAEISYRLIELICSGFVIYTEVDQPLYLAV